MAEYASPEEEWHDFLSGTHPHLQDKSPLRFIPSNPRCKLCKAPFGRPGGLLLRRYGFAPWAKNPKICGRCFKGLQEHASMCPGDPDGSEVRGAEVELSMLFADVRGSSKIARQQSALEFTQLMDRFYPDHAARAVEAARALFEATGYGSAEGPWVPLGAGVHSGSAFVGVVGAQDGRDFTALGDPMNIAAHLASQAEAGEILVTQSIVDRTQLVEADLEARHVSLKGFPLDAFLLPTRSTVAPTG